MKDQRAIATKIVAKLNISTANLYEYVNGDGSPKEKSTLLLK